MKHILIFSILFVCLSCQSDDMSKVYDSKTFVDKDKHTYKVIRYFSQDFNVYSIVHDPECKYCYEKFN